MRIPSIPTTSVTPAVSPTSGSATQVSGRSFAKTLTEAVSQVNKMQLQSADSGRELGLGTASSLHKVVLEAEEASLSMQMVVSLRNKALDAYQEVMRRQV